MVVSEIPFGQAGISSPKGIFFWILGSHRYISPSPLTGEGKGEGEQNLILPPPLYSLPPGQGYN